ncbi:MAG: DNA adenine methylase [Deltaproteobacteria bacterium]|nr:DNA adenine methylase [Deltaproteobacteria bacterium]
MINGRLHPILKWAGGKKHELKFILPKLPPTFANYYEPFVGGGAVYTAVKSNQYFINDKSEDLILLYKSIGSEKRDILFEAVEEIIHNWDMLTAVVENNMGFFVGTYKKFSTDKIDDEKIKQIMFQFIVDHSKQFNGMFSPIFNFNTANFIRELQINLIRKIKRMKHLEQLKQPLPDNEIADNIETALKSAFYMHFRHIHNHSEKYKISKPVKSAIFLYIRNFAYAAMFRYNSNGHFNVPYGGIGYNRKNFQKKIDYLKSQELKALLDRTTVENLDFEDFLKKHHPKKNDFIFLDPPYDSEFSTYTKNEFTKRDQMRLAKYLLRCKSKWMLVIKHTEFIRSLYNKKNLKIETFDKTYLVSFMNRNDKNSEHLLICNH